MAFKFYYCQYFSTAKNVLSLLHFKKYIKKSSVSPVENADSIHRLTAFRVPCLLLRVVFHQCAVIFRDVCGG